MHEQHQHHHSFSMDVDIHFEGLWICIFDDFEDALQNDDSHFDLAHFGVLKTVLIFLKLVKESLCLTYPEICLLAVFEFGPSHEQLLPT